MIASGGGDEGAGREEARDAQNEVLDGVQEEVEEEVEEEVAEAAASREVNEVAIARAPEGEQQYAERERPDQPRVPAPPVEVRQEAVQEDVNDEPVSQARPGGQRRGERECGERGVPRLPQLVGPTGRPSDWIRTHALGTLYQVLTEDTQPCDCTAIVPPWASHMVRTGPVCPRPLIPSTTGLHRATTGTANGSPAEVDADVGWSSRVTMYCEATPDPALIVVGMALQTSIVTQCVLIKTFKSHKKARIFATTGNDARHARSDAFQLGHRPQRTATSYIATHQWREKENAQCLARRQ